MILGNQFNFYLAVLYEIERVLQCWSGVSLAQVSVIIDLFSAAAAPSLVTIIGTRTRAGIMVIRRALAVAQSREDYVMRNV